MTPAPERKKAKRREFLKLVGLGGVAGAAALATGTPPAAQAEATPAQPGYRETPHIRKYYETAKF